jgi:hypothetical protein
MRVKRNKRIASRPIVLGLKITAVLIAVLVGLLACVHLLRSQRVEAFFWHLRHGSTVEIGDYRFPAPREWFVERNSPTNVLLTDLNTGDAIGVRIGRPSPIPLTEWAKLLGPPIVGDNIKVLSRRELQAGDETLLCVERDWDTGELHLFPITCRSQRGFEVEFTPYLSSGRDHNEYFYSLLQQTQKL